MSTPTEVAANSLFSCLKHRPTAHNLRCKHYMCAQNRTKKPRLLLLGVLAGLTPVERGATRKRTTVKLAKPGGLNGHKNGKISLLIGLLACSTDT